MKTKAILLTAICVSATALAAPKPAPVRASTETASANTDWAMHGLDPGETRFSPLAGIDAANVARLGVAWSADFDARSLRGWKRRRSWSMA
jgi:alcohol dehydrogenase (cytochrome c)/quinohemoprotein ethanol dehydrogenase